MTFKLGQISQAEFERRMRIFSSLTCRSPGNSNYQKAGEGRDDELHVGSFRDVM